jgi:hypothetical protein
VQVKNGRGQIVNLESVLNVPIALPEHERTGIELLREICAAVGKATQTNVVVGTVPINVFASYRIRLASLNEPARVVLIRTLEGTNRKLSWSLLYDPGAKMYALNVLPVLQEVSHPFGGTIRREIP